MKNVVILGSGRSGTSMLAGTIASAGNYYVGTDYIRPRDSNPKGFFEGEEVNSLNEQILASRLSWPLRQFALRRPAAPLRWLIRSRLPTRGQMWLARVPLDATFSVGPRIQEQIGRLSTHEPFCYKDPRFSYTLPVWRPFLRNTVFLCVFRSPAETVQSILSECQTENYLRRLIVDAELALQVWELMYTHVLERHRRQGQWVFVHFAQLFDRTTIDRIAALIEAPLKANFPDESLRRSRAQVQASSPVKQVYRALCDLAGYDPRDD